MASLEEGELEDGELLSSDEEEQGDRDGPEKVPTSKEISKDQSSSQSRLPKLIEEKKSSNTEASNHASSLSPKAVDEHKGSKDFTEDGEIFSDDEEAAYYPHQVRSRPRQPESKGGSDRKQSDGESQKSDSESLSGVRSSRSSRDRRERGRNLRSSPESETDNTLHSRSDTKERGLFYEDREGSGSESTGSRDRTRSRSRERDKDHHSSPKYGSRHGNRSRERDRSTRSRNDDDSSDRSSHYSRSSGGYGRTRGGYGGYQQRGGYGSPKFQGGGGGGQGGYTSSVQPGLMNTGMTAQQFHNVALKVKKRREDGLPLLPQPNLDKCGNLDQYNYPAPPSWYLEEVESWEKREKEEEEEKMKKDDIQKEKVVESTPEVVETKTPIEPLLRRNSSIALEIVSSPVSDGESPMVLADTTDNENNKDLVPLSEMNSKSHDLVQDIKGEEPMDVEPSTKAVPSETDATITFNVKSLRELATSTIQTDTESKPLPTTDVTSTAMETVPIATVSTVTVAIAMDTTAATDSTPTSATPQSSLDPSTSNATSSLPTPNSTTENTRTKTPPTITPLTITTESIVEEFDQSRSPSLSPTIPIQSSSLMKGVATKITPKSFRPKILSDSESEGEYDNYLDQLDEEEDEVDTKDSTLLLTSTLSEGFPLISESSAPSLTTVFKKEDNDDKVTNQILDSIGDPLSEDFPTIGKAVKKTSSNQNSLLSLLGQEVNTNDMDEKKPGDKKSDKSSRRKQKDAAWWSKQKDKEKSKPVVVSEDTKKSLPCKYYLSGNCKNGESCSYSHDCSIPKNKEICKFYLQGYCHKGSLCHYHHETFPCKYIHTRGFCKNGDHCRFSHAPLTPETRELLISVLDPAQVAVLPRLPADTSSLVISIPKEIVKGLIVSIPLHKLPPGSKFHSIVPPGPPTVTFPPPGSVPPPQQHQNQPPPRGPFPFQQQSGNPAPFLPNAPAPFGAPPHAPPPHQHQPVPLFPPKHQFQPPHFPLNQVPPPPAHRMPRPPPPGRQRKSLLPTPPPHMMISQEDILKMENSQPQEYWEAPELTQQNPPFPQQQPQPPMGGAPPFNGAPPNQYGQGGFHQQGPPPPTFPPQQQPPFGPHPPQQQPPPVYHHPGPHPPTQQWNELQGGGMGMIQQPGIEPNHPPGMDPRHNQASGSPSLFPPSRVDPRQKQAGQMGVAQHGPPRGGEMGPPPRDQMPHPPGAAQPWHPDAQGGGGWNAPPTGVGQPAPYHRHNGRQPYPQPHLHQQQHSYGTQQPNSGPVLPPYQQPAPMTTPYHTSGAMSPPQAVGGATQGQAPPTAMDNRSPVTVWGTSPEYSGSQSPGGGGVSASTGGDLRRRDPRTKYAHLKIKSKGQPSSSGGQSSQPILKRGAGEAGMESAVPGFKIPKLLQDTSNLNRPLDPRELFGSKDALSGGEEEYAGVTAPFGAFRSIFTQSQPSDADGNIADSAISSQKFGEITMGAAVDPSPAKAKESNKVTTGEKATPESAAKEQVKTEKEPASQVPSYLADLNVGLGSDLKIDSAFGSLSEKSTKDGDDSKPGSSSHDSQARKLPSIFGFS